MSTMLKEKLYATQARERGSVRIQIYRNLSRGTGTEEKEERERENLYAHIRGSCTKKKINAPRYKGDLCGLVIFSRCTERILEN